jgi:hypothetical protein
MRHVAVIIPLFITALILPSAPVVAEQTDRWQPAGKFSKIEFVGTQAGRHNIDRVAMGPLRPMRSSSPELKSVE